MMFRDWWQSRALATKRGRRVRGVEALEPRSVLSASGISSYTMEPLQAPPPPSGHPRDVGMTEGTGFVAPLDLHQRGELQPYRFEPRRTADAAPMQWQVTIIILPTLGVVAERGPSSAFESSSLLHSSQVPLEPAPQALNSLRTEATRELKTLDGLELESLTATLASASSWPQSGFTSFASTELESANDQAPLSSRAFVSSNQPSQHHTAEEVPRPTVSGAEETDGLVELETADSPLHPRRKIVRANPAGIKVNTSVLSPHALDYQATSSTDQHWRRMIRLPSEDSATQPANPESARSQPGMISSPGEADMIELLAADVASITFRDTSPRHDREHHVRLGSITPVKPESGLQLYQAFEVGDGEGQAIKDAVATADSPGTRPIRTAEDQE